MGTLLCVDSLNLCSEFLDSFTQVLDRIIADAKNRLGPPAACEAVRTDRPNQLSASGLGTRFKCVSQIDLSGRGEEGHDKKRTDHSVKVYASPNR